LIRLRRAAVIALFVHLVAGLCMAIILRRGLETNPDLPDRLAFVASHRLLWSAGWLSWTAAAIAILYFYIAFSDAHQLKSRFAVYLTVVALGPDLTAQAIEIGVLPGLAHAAPESFLLMHRSAVVMSGYFGNGLYSLTALILVWSSRRVYPVWVSAFGFLVGIFGLMLSVTALMDSAAGMLWTNVVLVPSLLIWLAGVALRTEQKPSKQL
jgi:hypothetical protein